MSATRVSRRRRPLLRTLAAVAVVAALYVWDDVIFATPIAIATGLLGPWPAFLLMASLFSLGSYGLALLAVRAYDRSVGGEPSRLERWLQQQAEGRRGRLGARLLRSGRVLGFILSSFVLGGIATTWLIRYGGRRQGIERLAALSCLIFGISFVGMYTGLFGLVLG